MSNEKQPTGNEPVASDGAAARAGNETDPPPYAAMPAAAPEDLPKALSAEERILLDGAGPYYDIRHRALALIDALTEHLAEAVARMTAAEKTADDYGDGLLDGAEKYAALESERDAALARAEAAERNRTDAEHQVTDELARVAGELVFWRTEARRLQTETDAALRNQYSSALSRAESEADALRAENERLRGVAQERNEPIRAQNIAYDRLEAKFAAAAPCPECEWVHEPGQPECIACVRTEAGQPAAPTLEQRMDPEWWAAYQASRRAGQPAAPAPDRTTALLNELEQWKTRTEAEQRVLDSVRRWVDGESDAARIAEAEHARREANG